MMHSALPAQSREQHYVQRPVHVSASAGGTAARVPAGSDATAEQSSSRALEPPRIPPPSTRHDGFERDCVGVPIFPRPDEAKNGAGVIDKRPADIEVELLTPAPVPLSPMCGWDVSAHCFSPGLHSPCLTARHAPTPPPPASMIADEIYEASKQRKYEARVRKQARAEARAEARRAKVQEIMASAHKEKEEIQKARYRATCTQMCWTGFFFNQTFSS